jgi:hypothetical protein
MGTIGWGYTTDQINTETGSASGVVGSVTSAAPTGENIGGSGVINTYSGVGSVGQFSWDNAATLSPSAKPVSTPSSVLLDSIQGRMRGCLLLDDGQVNYYLNPTNWAQKADGSASILTGADGMVMVEVPKFYVKNTSVGTLWRPAISATPLPGYVVHPAFIKAGVEVPYRYYSAYDACVRKVQAITGATQANPVVVTSNNHGLQTGDTCAITGVVGMTQLNDRTFTVTRVSADTFSLNGEDGTGYTAYSSGGSFTAFIGGGNLDNATTIVSLTAGTGSKLSSVSGVYPMVGLTLPQYRTLASNRGTGWTVGDYALWSAIGLLLAVEAQTFDSQSVYGAGNSGTTYATTAADPTQAGSGNSISGKGNALGNGSTDAVTGAASASRGVAYCKYRGIENFWGNCWNFLDGIVTYSQGNSVGNKVFAYWSNDFNNFASVTNASASTAIPTGYSLLSEIANALNTFRYSTQMSNAVDWAGVVTGFSDVSTDGTTDLYRTGSLWRVSRCGGAADFGSYCGAFAFGSDLSSSTVQRGYGARLCY